MKDDKQNNKSKNYLVQGLVYNEYLVSIVYFFLILLKKKICLWWLPFIGPISITEHLIGENYPLYNKGHSDSSKNAITWEDINMTMEKGAFLGSFQSSCLKNLQKMKEAGTRDTTNTLWGMFKTWVLRTTRPSFTAETNMAAHSFCYYSE